VSARLDHLVIAVDDLEQAASRWRAAGLPASRGGAHPVGTENVLVRGPQPAYVELIAAGSGESNPWLDRVRAARGLISWAIAVDDIDAAREALLEAGFEPDPPVPGSRRTPEGDLLEWRVCDVGTGPYDGTLPFLIQWTTPMAPGRADGPIIEHVGLTPPDPDRLADLLLALGFAPSRHWPRRMFHEVTSRLAVTLNPVVSLSLATPSGEPAHHLLDGVAVSTHPDRRRFAAASLLPAVDEAFARLRGDLVGLAGPAPRRWSHRRTRTEYSQGERIPGKLPVAGGARRRLGGCRSSRRGWAWPNQVDPAAVSLGGRAAPSSRAGCTVVRGAAGTQRRGGRPRSPDETFVQRRHRGPGRGAGACSRSAGATRATTGSAALVEAIDNAFVLALSGGVYAVRDGASVVSAPVAGRVGEPAATFGRRRARAVAGRRGRRTAYGRGRGRGALALISGALATSARRR
jgi:hypothetical protein